MVRRRREPWWHLLLTVLLMASAVAAILVQNWQTRNAEHPPELPFLPAAELVETGSFGDRLYARIDTTLAELGIWPELISKQRQYTSPELAGTLIDSIAVRVPAGLPLTVVNLALTQLTRRLGGAVFRAVEHGSRRVALLCGIDSTTTTVFALRRDRRLKRRVGSIAIVLADFGADPWNRPLAQRFCALPQVLTLAVLPNDGHPRAIVEMAKQHGHEVLLHLPMEPHGYPESDPGEGAIFADQDGETIRRLLIDGLRKVSSAVGVKNYMGSRVTADSRVMKEILSTLKERHLFFLDGRSTPETLGLVVASDLQVPAVGRDLVIDGLNAIEGKAATKRQIEAKLWELAALATRQGHAIGVGHGRETTLLALEAALPRLESRGYRFVPVSKLVR